MQNAFIARKQFRLWPVFYFNVIYYSYMYNSLNCNFKLEENVTNSFWDNYYSFLLVGPLLGRVLHTDVISFLISRHFKPKLCFNRLLFSLKEPIRPEGVFFRPSNLIKLLGRQNVPSSRKNKSRLRHMFGMIKSVALSKECTLLSTEQPDSVVLQDMRK